MNMKGIQSNGFLPIIAQAIAEMEHKPLQKWKKSTVRFQV